MFPIRGRLGAQLLAVAAFLAAGCADAFLPFCPFLPTSIRKGICFCSDRGGFRGEYGVRVDGNPESEEPSLTLLTCEFEHTDEGGVQALRDWLRKYPYAAVLPVQPLMTMHTTDGLDLIFRKKPTKERGTQDGGMRVEVIVKSALWDSHRWPGATRKIGGQGAQKQDGASRPESPGLKGRKGGQEREDKLRYTLLVTRISEGQQVSKFFSEKIVVNKLVEDAKDMPPECGKLVSFVKNLDARGPLPPLY